MRTEAICGVPRFRAADPHRLFRCVRCESPRARSPGYLPNDLPSSYCKDSAEMRGIRRQADRADAAVRESFTLQDG
jgi:hypothetical protein